MNDDSADQISTMRLYGSVIAVVSGGYSLYLATSGPGMTGAAWLMLVLGAVVILHGVVLLTPLVVRLGAASGPLMIGYSLLMLLNQVWMTMMDGGMDSGMDGTGGMNGGMADGAATMAGPDAGMVAIALLMLTSGVIMTARREMLPGE